jgi:hypothetical protein
MQTKEEIAQLTGNISTVVSCLPFVVNKNIPHCYPGNFRIPEVKDVFKECEILYVGNVICQFYVGGDVGENSDGWLKKTIPSDEIAAAICRDEVGSCINIIPGVAQPAILWLTGFVSKEEVVLKHHARLEDVRAQQKRWFIELVNEADKDYAKLRNPGVVSKLQRRAAQILGLKKEWDIETAVADIAQCPMCQATVNPAAIMCSNCRYILNEEVYKVNKDRFMTSVTK